MYNRKLPISIPHFQKEKKSSLVLFCGVLLKFDKNLCNILNVVNFHFVYLPCSDMIFTKNILIKHSDVKNVSAKIWNLVSTVKTNFHT